MDNKPHGREKKVGTGSVSVGKGRKVGTGGPVGGSSQQGRPGSNSGGAGRGPVEPQRGPGGRGVGLLGLLAIFAFIPKKFRGIAIIAVIAILLFSFMGGGGNSAVPTAPTYTIVPQSESSVQSLDDSNMMFSSSGYSSLSDLFGAYGLYGSAGSAYSGSTPSGSSTPVGSGGLLQGLPGTSVSPTATPKPTPKPTATPKPTSTPKPTKTPKPAATSAPVQAMTRDKRVTPIGGGKDTVTVMIYMCGTDLESKYGMATSDLSEMVKANLSDQVQVIVLTGGCRSWKNSIMSNSVNQIYRVHSGGLERLEDNFGSSTMVDPTNLTKFIQYCNKNYPANRNFLIMWDHGGGSISGYGYDEKNTSDGSMPLTKINKALDDANVVFDWIGYDACLMSTLETALVSANYADYLIASEEVEPGTGWYYTEWLNALSKNTSISTEDLSKILIDSYVTACRQRSYNAQVTLAVTDLAELESTVPQVFRDFSVSTNALISSDSYSQVSNARAGARQFAQSTRINQVDLTDLALRIGTEESNALAKTLQSCVKYNGTTISRCYGLSIYFPYETLNSVSSAISTYDSLGFDEEYAKVIKSFASLEYGGQASSAYGTQGSWGSLFGSPYGSSGSSWGGSSSGSSSGGAYGSYGSYGDFLEALLGTYMGSSSPSGSLSGGYSNSYGQSSAGYSLSASDIAGLLNAFSGRSMPADRSWVDTDLIASQADNIAATFLDPGRITVSYRDGRPVLELTDKEWVQIQSVELNVFVDDGEGYVDLGLDNTLYLDGNVLPLEFDCTWLTLNGQIVAYYLVSDTQNPDGSWTTVGRIPALLNGELMNLQVLFDDENPYGTVTGAYPLYENGETETQPKGLVPILPGDTLEFICDYYGYDNSYLSSYTLGTGFTVSDALELENLSIENDTLIASCRLTDIYGNHYWLSF